jgi:hypothetical protein
METSMTGSTDNRPAAASAGSARARQSVTAKLDNAVVIFAQKKLAGRAHHAARFDTPDGADLERFAAGRNHRAGTRQHHLDAGAGIGRAADDLEIVFSPIADHAQAQLVGIGMFFRSDDLGDHEVLQRRASVCDAFDFQTDGGQLVGDGLGVGIGVQMLFQPAQREFHLLSPPSREGISSAAKP